MNPADFIGSSAGTCLQTLDGYHAFFPNPLPPVLEPDWDLVRLISEADRAMSELSGAGQRLPNPHLLIRPYLKREAILSSRIEDTHAEMEDLAVLEEQEGTEPDAQVREVANYVTAMERGLEMIRDLPISTRLIKQLHAILLHSVRGGESTKTPGEFRRSQNWIGPNGCHLNEASFVPPPHYEIGPAMSAWEKYVNCDSKEPPLVKMALMHYQFETIHPFLNGNGRIGRLLITLYLCKAGCLSQPLLYLSGFFDETRDEYYRLLMNVSRKGAWREWIDYFLRGVRLQADRAIGDTNNILQQYDFWRNKLNEGLRVPGEASRMLDLVFANPVVSISRYATRYDINYPNAKKAVDFWVDRGLLSELNGIPRPRYFIARGILNLMTKPAAPGNAEPVRIEQRTLGFPEGTQN
jgi:Fic family protein